LVPIGAEVGRAAQRPRKTLRRRYDRKIIPFSLEGALVAPIIGVLAVVLFLVFVVADLVS
jgi:hypothetical protein